MPCLIGCLAVSFPRLVLAVLFLFTGYPAVAFNTWVWPVLGFIFAPYTTLAYIWAMNAAGQVSGGFVVVMVIAVLADLASHGGGGRSGYRHYQRR